MLLSDFYIAPPPSLHCCSNGRLLFFKLAKRAHLRVFALTNANAWIRFPTRPVQSLLAGIPSKTVSQRRLPWLVNLNSYPTSPISVFSLAPTTVSHAKYFIHFSSLLSSSPHSNISQIRVVIFICILYYVIFST